MAQRKERLSINSLYLILSPFGFTGNNFYRSVCPPRRGGRGDLQVDGGGKDDFKLQTYPVKFNYSINFHRDSLLPLPALCPMPFTLCPMPSALCYAAFYWHFYFGFHNLFSIIILIFCQNNENASNAPSFHFKFQSEARKINQNKRYKTPFNNSRPKPGTHLIIKLFYFTLKNHRL